MKRVVSLQYSSGKILGEVFAQEARGGVYVGVAVLNDDAAVKFEGRDDFEVEDLEASEVHTFPADLPLLAPQKAALAKAGLTDLAALAAYDWAQKIPGVGDTTVKAIQAYIAGSKPE